MAIACFSDIVVGHVRLMGRLIGGLETPSQRDDGWDDLFAFLWGA